jgi:hypothetical protein
MGSLISLCACIETMDHFEKLRVSAMSRAANVPWPKAPWQRHIRSTVHGSFLVLCTCTGTLNRFEKLLGSAIFVAANAPWSLLKLRRSDIFFDGSPGASTFANHFV